MDEQKLRAIPLFAGLGKNDLRRLAQATDEIDVREGKALLREGAFAYEFMVIQEGKAEVTRQGEHIADLGPGDVLGEVAALDRGTRNATVVATSPMRLAVMTARDLRALASAIPDLERTLKAMADERRPLTPSA
ncbi:MAG TPA: cyclic nucleotide-binding domain-containing protein [Baekduia sp.]|nr:cyclic nucleotide-binding domain-containing protein [Baekduia sp.]